MSEVLSAEEPGSPGDLLRPVGVGEGDRSFCHLPWTDSRAAHNHKRYHELVANLTPADVCFGRAEEEQTRREEIKQRTLQTRCLQCLQTPLPVGACSIKSEQCVFTPTLLLSHSC